MFASLVLAAACAVVEPPPGGPIDMTPPHLAAMDPDSGATGLAELKTIRLTFSEKMDRTSAVTWLHFFPDQRIRQTKWHGATEAEVILEDPLPPDTVFVVEVAADMRDAHKVKGRKSRRFPIATGDSIPGGAIHGVLIMADSAVTNGVVELYDIPPDTLEYFQQPLLRRTATDENGTYRFDWLPVPGGPWLVRAFADPDINLRPGDKEAQRLLPDTLRLSNDNPLASPGVTTLYAWNTPGRLLVGPFDTPLHGDDIFAWTLSISEEDTGWVPAPEDGSSNPIFPLDPAAGGVIGEVKPGLSRAILFVDMDGDSTFSGIPDSLLAFLPDSLRVVPVDTVAAAEPDTTGMGTWYLEPWLMVEGLTVEPGLDSELEVPVLPYYLTPWTPPEPEPAAADSVEADVTGTPKEGE
ncbi:MAG: Ig-like domain-containing protein [Candidatus Krumholzibacteriota bacterium]